MAPVRSTFRHPGTLPACPQPPSLFSLGPRGSQTWGALHSPLFQGKSKSPPGPLWDPCPSCQHHYSVPSLDTYIQLGLSHVCIFCPTHSKLSEAGATPLLHWHSHHLTHSRHLTCFSMTAKRLLCARRDAASRWEMDPTFYEATDQR